MELKYTWQEDDLKTNIKRRKFRDNSFTLFYPSDKIKDAKFQSSQQISTFLLQDALQIGYCKWQLFQKAVVDKGDYIKIIYTCRKQYCDATLIYHQKKVDFSKDIEVKKLPRKFYLTEVKIINRHRHVLRLTPKIASEQNIRQYLFDLPVQQRFQNHVQVIKQKYNLSKCQTRYLKERVFWKFKNEDHMLRKLTERKVIFRRKIQNGNTTILLLVSQTMKKSYLKYGDILCFDITYKLLKKKRGQAKHLGVGFFVGQDQNSRIILYAVSTIQHETSQNFYYLLEYFFEIVEHPPQTIVTDDQRALNYAISKLKTYYKYNYVHLLDWFHKMKAMERILRKQTHRQQLLTLFMRILKESSRQVSWDIAKQIAELIQNPKIMIDFLSEQNKYCLSYTPQKFFAFGIASARAEAFNNLIKKSVPHQTNLGRLVYFVLRVEKRLLNRMAVLNFMLEQISQKIRDEQVVMLSKKLQHLAFEQVRQYYEQSRNLQKVQQGSSPVHKFISYCKYERDYRINLMYDIKYDCWRCQCKNNFRTGMPCAHLVRVIRQYKGSISYYISERWFHFKSDATIKKASRPNLKNKRI